MYNILFTVQMYYMTSENEMIVRDITEEEIKGRRFVGHKFPIVTDEQWLCFVHP
jgi:hypothetical protein